MIQHYVQEALSGGNREWKGKNDNMNVRLREKNASFEKFHQKPNNFYCRNIQNELRNESNSLSIRECRSGNFIQMVHNGIKYGDMQLTSEAYDVLKNVGGSSNTKVAKTFDEWNKGKLESFLIEITVDIFKVKDEHGEGDWQT